MKSTINNNALYDNRANLNLSNEVTVLNSRVQSLEKEKREIYDMKKQFEYEVENVKSNEKRELEVVFDKMTKKMKETKEKLRQC